MLTSNMFRGTLHHEVVNVVAVDDDETYKNAEIVWT